jgi:hypothetical protein
MEKLRATSLRTAAMPWHVTFAALEPTRKRSRTMASVRHFNVRSVRLDIVTWITHEFFMVTPPSCRCRFNMIYMGMDQYLLIPFLMG